MIVSSPAERPTTNTPKNHHSFLVIASMQREPTPDTRKLAASAHPRYRPGWPGGNIQGCKNNQGLSKYKIIKAADERVARTTIAPHILPKPEEEARWFLCSIFSALHRGDAPDAIDVTGEMNRVASYFVSKIAYGGDVGSVKADQAVS